MDNYANRMELPMSSKVADEEGFRGVKESNNGFLAELFLCTFIMHFRHMNCCFFRGKQRRRMVEVK
jgi:hypothetical protein